MPWLVLRLCLPDRPLWHVAFRVLYPCVPGLVVDLECLELCPTHLRFGLLVGAVSEDVLHRLWSVRAVAEAGWAVGGPEPLMHVVVEMVVTRSNSKEDAAFVTREQLEFSLFF